MKSTRTTNPETDLRAVCGQKLLALKNNLTAKNKVDALATFRLSRPTLEKYLNGSVARLETGLELLQFFQTKINEAKQQLATA